MKQLFVAMFCMCTIGVYAANKALDSHRDTVRYTSTAPTIDGISSDLEWARSDWRLLDFPIIGELPDAQDFSGRYRLLWDENFLYINLALQDDVLFDGHSDPLQNYWDDDCVEIFVDEDGSGGDHLSNFNAFAYHVALDGNVVDIGPSETPGETNFVLLNSHVESRWTKQSYAPYTLNWELKVQLHNDDFSLLASQKEKPRNTRVLLTQNKEVGFMLAYCDNDGSKEREHFIGSHPISPINGDKNLGYKTADVFATLRLVK